MNWKLHRRRLLLAVLIGAAVAGGGFARSAALQRLLQTLVERQLAAETGARVRIAEFHFGWRQLTLDLHGVELRGREAAGQPALAAIPHAWMRLNPAALLRGQVEFAQMSLEDPAFHLTRVRGGGLNLPLAAASEAPPIFTLGVGALSVRGGELELEGHLLPFAFDAHQVRLYAQREGAVYRAEARFAADPGAVGSWHPGPMQAEAALRLSADRMEVTRAEAQGAGFTVRLRGEAAPLTAPVFVGTYEIEGALAPVARAEGVDEVAAGTLRAAGAVRWNGSDWTATGALSLANLRFRNAPPGLAVWSGTGEFRATPGGMQLQRLLLQRPGSQVAVHASWNDARHWQAAADVGGIGLGALDSLLAYAKLDARARASLAALDGTLAGHIEVASGLTPQGMRTQLALTLSPGDRGLPVSGSAQLEFSGAGQQWDIQRLELAAAGSTLRGSGRLPEGITLDVNLGEVRQLAPLVEPWLSDGRVKDWIASLPLPLAGPVAAPGWARVSGGGTVHLKLTGAASNLAADVSATLANFVYGSMRLQAASGSAVVTRGAVELRQLRLQSGGQVLSASGTLGLTDFQPDPERPLRVEVSAQNIDLARWKGQLPAAWAPLNGRASVSAQLAGTAAQPNGRGHLDAEGLEWQGKPVGAMSGDFTLAQRRLEASALTVQLGQTRITGTGGVDLNARTFHLALASAGVNLAEVAQLQSARLPVAGSARLQLQGSGRWDDPDIELTLSSRQLQGAGEDLGEVEATLHLQHGVGSFRATDQLGTASLIASGTVGTAAPYPLAAQVQLRDYDFDAWLRRFTPAEVTGHSEASGTIALSGPLATPAEMRATLDLDPVVLAVSGLEIHNQGAVRLAADAGGIAVVGAHFLAPQTNLTVSGRVNLGGGAPRLDLTVQGAVNLALVDSLHPGTHAHGSVNLEARVEGGLEQPSINGEVSVSDATLSEDGLPLAFDAINGSIRFSGDRAQIERFSARTGSGAISFSGFVARSRGGLVYQLNADGTGMRVRYLGISASTDLQLRLTTQPGGALLSGEAVLTRIALDPDFDLAAFIANSRIAGSPSSADSLLAHTRLDVHIATAPQLELTTTTARMLLSGDLRLRGTAASPAVLGRASASQGSVLFAGNQYRVDKGDVQFTNPFRIEPLLDLELSTTVPPYEVTLNVEGAVDKLAITYRSDPPLSSTDIVNLLATGAPTQATAGLSSQSSGEFVSQSEQLLGRALDNAVAGRLQRLFGITEVQVNPNSLLNGVAAPGSSVTIQQQVSRDVKLTYTQNLSSSSQDIVQVEWTLTSTLGILLNRDQYGLYGLQFIFHHRAR